MPTVTVIMPVHNTKDTYLKEAIESILNQTFADFEFIIINDGSTNNAEDIILSYKDERIKYIKQENEGIAKTRNLGMELSNCKYIAFADSDDISLPDRLYKQVNFLETHPRISLVSGWFETFPNGQIYKNKQNPKCFDFLKNCQIAQGASMFRKQDFEKYNLKYDESFNNHAEDYDLWSRVIRVLNVANLQEVLIKYRMHEKNATKSNKLLIENDLIVKQNILNFLTEDKVLQSKIIDIFINTPIKNSFMENIFSMKNRNFMNKKMKFITVFGIKFKIKCTR